MNGISRRFKCFSTAIVACAFLMSSEMPLFANPPQQSNTASQKQDDSLPDAPQSQSTQTPSSQQPATVPSGVAGAKAPNVKGAPVAQPAGAAIAPVRQRGHRSLLIKLGLLAGAGIAVGSVVALSEKSPARTPGTSAATHP
jgi:predicted lipid-binding transport protein (Tim44 family)